MPAKVRWLHDDIERRARTIGSRTRDLRRSFLEPAVQRKKPDARPELCMFVDSRMAKELREHAFARYRSRHRGPRWHCDAVRPRSFVVAAAALVLVACSGGGGGGLSGSSSSNTTPSGAQGKQPIRVDSLDVPATARATAQALARVEPALRGADRSPDVLRKLGREQQLAYRQIAAHPSWSARAIAAVPKKVREAVRANIAAGTALGGLTGTAPSGFPDWTIETPPAAAKLRGYYDEAEKASGVSWAYLAAIHLVETRMGRIHGNSTAGAQGPMQFIQATWDRYGEGGDITDNHDAILAAGRYLAASNAATNIDRALFSYNNDDRYVAAIKAYAAVLLADPRAYDGYYQWQVFYATTDGTFLLPEGYRGS